MKNKVRKFIPIFLMLFMIAGFPKVNTYAADDPWASYKEIGLNNTADIEYGSDFFDWHNSGMYHNLTCASYVKFYFYGTKLRILDDFCSNRKTGSIIYIDNYPGEEISSYSSGFARNACLYSKSGLPDKLHSAYISIPYQYGQYFSMFFIDVDKDGYITKDVSCPSYYKNLNVNAETKNRTLNKNEEFTVDLSFKDLENMALANVKLNYDPAKFQYEGYIVSPAAKLIKMQAKNGEVRAEFRNLGDLNVVNKFVPISLKFKAIGSGMSVMDISKVDVSDNTRNIAALSDKQCGRLFMNIK